MVCHTANPQMNPLTYFKDNKNHYGLNNISKRQECINKRIVCINIQLV